MEIIYEQTWLIVLITSMFVLGFKLIRYQRYISELDEAKTEIRSLRMKITRLNNPPDLPEGGGDNIGGLVHSLLPHLPSWLKPIAGNEVVINKLIEGAQKNPELLKGLIDKLGTGNAPPATNNNTGISL